MRRTKVLKSLMDANFECDMTASGFGENPWGNTIILKQAAYTGGRACPCLEVLMAHEAADDLRSIFGNSEGYPETIENKCFTCALVFVGQNLEPGDTGTVYFQDAGSFLGGIRYSDSNDADEDEVGAVFYSFPAENAHVLEYEQAVDVLLFCSIRREEKAKASVPRRKPR